MDNTDATFLRAFVADPTPRRMASSPLLELLETELVAWEPDGPRLTMLFSPPAVTRQGAGVIQGGIIGTMLDFAMVLPAFAVLPKGNSLTTTSMTTNFYGPGTGTQFTAVGRLDKTGRRIIFASAQLFEGERAIASASATMMVLPGKTL
jgi:uncharacterized protein (TIGR00369 family)